MSKTISKGYLVAFFFICLLQIQNSNAQQFGYSFDSAISEGLLDTNYWKNQTASSFSNSKVSAFTDTKIEGSFKMNENLGFFTERREQNTLITNQNSLFIASNLNTNVLNNSIGNYYINANITKVAYDSIGLIFDNAFGNVNWKLKPKLINPTNYSNGSLSGNLSNDGNSQHFDGDLTKEGTSAYGYFSNPASTNFSTGFSLDAQFELNLESEKVHFVSNNLLSHFDANALNQTSNTYRIDAINGSIQANNIPSLYGTYAQTNTSLRLPRITTVGIEKELVDFHHLRNEFGIVNINGNSIYYLSSALPFNNFEISVKTFNLNNIYLSAVTNNLWVKNVGFDFSIALSGQSIQTFISRIQYSF